MCAERLRNTTALLSASRSWVISIYRWFMLAVVRTPSFISDVEYMLFTRCVLAMVSQSASESWSIDASPFFFRYWSKASFVGGKQVYAP